MKKKAKKVILFLVEGASDLTSLEFIDNINTDETIKFQITSGDVTSKINSIPYEMYYMSCNLEHVLHDKLEDISEDEKKELANKFADRFYEKEIEFIDFINNKDFKVLGDYKATWDFIKKDLNSVNRYSNFWLFFENLK